MPEKKAMAELSKTFGVNVLGMRKLLAEGASNDYLESIDEKQLYGDFFVIRKSDHKDYIIRHTGLMSTLM